jgi:phosphatidyl-myo-inositol dimannoside synthase
LDGSREALKDGELGSIINPLNSSELKAAIINNMKRPTRSVPAGLYYFTFDRFKERIYNILASVTD